MIKHRQELIIKCQASKTLKYKERVPVIKLQEVFYSTFNQVGSKFKYSRVSPPGGSTSGYKDALELLIKAGIAHRIFHTAARGLPLGYSHIR